MTRPYAVKVVHSSLGEVVRVVSADSEHAAMQLLVDRGFIDPSGEITADSPEVPEPVSVDDETSEPVPVDDETSEPSEPVDDETSEPSEPVKQAGIPVIPTEAALKKMLVPEIDEVHAGLPVPIDGWATMNKGEKITNLTAASRLGDD